SQDCAVRFGIAAPAGKIVERDSRRLDEVPADEGCALACSLLGALHAALPFEYGPAIEADAGHKREHAAEIDLAVAQRTEASGSLVPWLGPPLDPDAGG